MAGRDRKRKNLAKMRTQMDEQIDAMQSAEQTGQDDAKGKRRGHEGDGEEETEIDQKRKRKNPTEWRTPADCPVPKCEKSYTIPSSLTRHMVLIHGWGAGRVKELLNEVKNATEDPGKIV